MKKLNHSNKCTTVFFILVFLLMFVCNFFTGMLADDYSYCFSYSTGERITNIMQIFTSLRAHADYMNGRLVAHFWAHLFLMLPSWIFDIVNSFMFTLQIFVMYKISIILPGKKHNNMLIPLIFGCIWIFQPVFGQVNLWLDGACNYLWAISFGLIFIMPYVNLYIKNQPIKNIALQVLFPIFSLLFGAHSENASSAFIFMAMLFLVLTFIYVNKKIPVVYFISIATAVLGYISIYRSPAQIEKKAADFSLMALRNNFAYCFEVFKEFWILLAIFVVLFVLCVYLKTEKKGILLSLVFFLGGMASHFIMTFAGYYADRSAFCVVALLTLAVAILFNQLTYTSFDILLICILAVLMLPLAHHVVYGVNDIYNTHLQMQANIEHIYESKENNELDVTINMINSKTAYSAALGMHYADPDSTESWPNPAIANYYGVNSIIGYYP